MYQIRELSDIKFGGGVISSYIIVRDGEIVPEPTIYLLNRSKFQPSINTSKAYAQSLKTFFEVLESSSSDIDWKSVTEPMMSHYINDYLLGERKLSEKSLNPHIEALKDFYQWAWKTRLLDKPKRFSFSYSKGRGELSREKRNISLKSQYIAEADFILLLSNVTSNHKEHKSYIVERNELILCLGYMAGLRAAEVTDVRNFNTVEVRKLIEEAKKESKKAIRIEIIGKGKKLRYIDIDPALFEKIDHFISNRRLKIPDGPMIANYDGSPLSPGYASTVFGAVRSKCYSSCTSKKWDSYSFHSLRHTYATNLVTWCYENGVDPKVRIPERLGHEDWQTTLNYLHFEAVKNGRSSVLEDLALYRKEKGSSK